MLGCKFRLLPGSELLDEGVDEEKVKREEGDEVRGGLGLRIAV